MALDYVTLASDINNIYEEIKDPSFTEDPKTYFMEQQSIKYDADANNGDLSADSVVLHSNPESLHFDVINDTITATRWADVIRDYWVGQTDFGTPQYGGTINSIVNDGDKIHSNIVTYLLSLTSIPKEPPYEHIYEFIENQVKSIIWTVTEIDPSGTTHIYEVNII